ncbi:helix-turn-helix domain-containing protein [Nonomuraea lactucae]|uniref:helix-turn-helix domain-containing protein n=1 Tax=Nonomuraea lactucae TaxID=2249762 RepID=UPI0013B3BFEC
MLATHRPAGAAGWDYGGIVRKACQAAGLTLAELGTRTGYPASQVSPYERGLTPLTDLLVLRRFANALNIARRPSTWRPTPPLIATHGSSPQPPCPLGPRPTA